GWARAVRQVPQLCFGRQARRMPRARVLRAWAFQRLVCSDGPGAARVAIASYSAIDPVDHNVTR
ncbi:MAG TPA: hypothetical protein VF167_13470, partial [Longimicrobiaceae bacterium]